MRQLVVLVVLGCSSLSVLSAQPALPPAAPEHQTGGRASYDPMAQAKGNNQPKGIVETTLAGVNSQNKDYSVVIEDWRKEVFENTLGQIYFWGLIGLGLMLGVSVIGNGWLLRDRERRLTISADIVAQLYNAYIVSRSRALDAISRHNKLVDRYNRLDDEAAELRTKTAQISQTDPVVGSDFNDAKEAKPPEVALSAAQLAPSNAPDEPEADEEGSADLKTKVEELETKLKRKEAQLQAKDNHISNLRNRLTQAHDSLQGERAKNTGKQPGRSL